LLVENGADCNVLITDNGKTPLMYAARAKNESFVQFLLDRGADYNAKDQQGKTALAYAADARNEAAVKSLLSRGADTESRL
jgi:uncharacterized protein